MKNEKYVFKNNGIKIVTSIGMSAIFTLTSACAVSKPNNDLTESMTSVTEESIYSEITTTTETPTPTPVSYDFTWTPENTDGFADYFEGKYGSCTLSNYIKLFGFTDELNSMFTEYVNLQFNRNYEYVPFSKAKYFHYIVVDKDCLHVYNDNYDNFCRGFLSENSSQFFTNKLILSYLIQNKVVFGQRISTHNLEQIIGKEIYTPSSYSANVNAYELHKCDSSYEYSSSEVCTLLMYYNKYLYVLLNDERISPQDYFTDDPEYTEKCAEAIEMYNGYLKQYYGENAPQFGEIVTREQYFAIFGEEPLDLSYIPGAVVNDSAAT